MDIQRVCIWKYALKVFLRYLLGGLDILKEMHENKELESTIPKKQDLNTRLKEIINRAPLMVFMKGEPDAPKCGFSNQLMHIFKVQPLKQLFLFAISL